MHFDLRHATRPPVWLTHYPRDKLSQDLLAGLIVGILVIPQSLGYAMLSGLPPVYGLYSAMVPVLVYAWVGSSNVNAVGPVAITAIMTAQALQPYSELPPAHYAIMASFLALMTGTILWLASVFRLGWITQFISRGVTAGFISGAAILILVGQIKYVTGIAMGGNSLPEYIETWLLHRHERHVPTLMVGVVAFLLLLINRYWLKQWLTPWLPTKKIDVVTRVLPLLVLAVGIAASGFWHFADDGILTIANVPTGLPHFVMPFYSISPVELLALLPAAGLMALIAFVSSNSVASSYARRRGELYYANQELRGLGLANMAGAFFQSFTTVGGFSRTAINVDAGAQSPLASVLSVVVMAIVLVFFSQLLAPLPYAILGATIMSAIISMVDLDTLRQALRYDKLDAAAFLVALVGVLLFGLNVGLVAGLFTSFAGLIWQSSHPHIAIVGQIGDTGHFRNIHRHQVTQLDALLIIRVDESLFYGNAQSVLDFIEGAVAAHPATKDVVLMLSAVNHIDLTAQDMLINLTKSLASQQINLHFSEVKGPVMDIIEQTEVIHSLTGHVFLSTAEAVQYLSTTQVYGNGG